MFRPFKHQFVDKQNLLYKLSYLNPVSNNPALNKCVFTLIENVGTLTKGGVRIKTLSRTHQPGLKFFFSSTVEAIVKEKKTKTRNNNPNPLLYG